MRTLTRIFGWFYTQSLKLYPFEFRSNFGEEMGDVFSQAAHQSTANAINLFLRELRDLPANLLLQHWLAIRKEGIPMTTISSSSDVQIQLTEPQPGTWGAAILAGLPHLLMGLLIGVGKLLDQTIRINQNISTALVISLALLVVAILCYAWRYGWPLWSASWYLYGTWVSIAIIGLGIESLDLEDSWRYTNAMFLGWILLCIVGYFFILAKSKLHGLLSVAFLFPLLSLVMMEFVPNPIEGWLAISVGLLAAMAAGTILRVADLLPALGLVLGLNLAVGLALAYISEYKMLDLPSGLPAHVPRFTNFLEFLAFYSIFGLGVVTIPFILRGLWNFGRRKLAS
ncbi:MAG: hypothetical protein MUO62_18730 [Anaerolineales bacterium]|nr:hypothetical protein [Anaerolineales bacterium]